MLVGNGVAGCGADAAPYFRVFNPILQAKKFDTNGEYIRKYVPELANLPNKILLEMPMVDEKDLEKYDIILGKNYPKPIVDLLEARDQALHEFSKIKNPKP